MTRALRHLNIVRAKTNIRGVVFNPHIALFTPARTPGVTEDPRLRGVIPAHQYNRMVHLTATAGCTFIRAEYTAATIRLKSRAYANRSGDWTIVANSGFELINTGYSVSCDITP